VRGGTDFHNHLVPGVDDGARDLDESAAALRRFQQQGVTQLITTPHVDASLAERPEALALRLGQLDRPAPLPAPLPGTRKLAGLDALALLAAAGAPA